MRPTSEETDDYERSGATTVMAAANQTPVVGDRPRRAKRRSASGHGGGAEKLDGNEPAETAVAIACAFSATRGCRWQILSCETETSRRRAVAEDGAGEDAPPGARVRMPGGPGEGVSAPPCHGPATHAMEWAATPLPPLPSRFPRQPNQPVSSPSSESLSPAPARAWGATRSRIDRPGPGVASPPHTAGRRAPAPIRSGGPAGKARPRSRRGHRCPAPWPLRRRRRRHERAGDPQELPAMDATARPAIVIDNGTG
uniref:Uncharacterized protein n=1 Tax=Setaria italica TaxID=4555 RepID=K3YJA3_SETIT